MDPKKLGQVVNEQELKEAGFDLRRILKIGLIALGALAVALGLIFVALPLIGNVKKADDGPQKLPITFHLENISDRDWKGVTFKITGVRHAPEGAGKFSYLSDEFREGYIEDFVGDVKRGESKLIRITITAHAKGEFSYVTTFTDSSGVIVRLPETKKLVFR